MSEEMNLMPDILIDVKSLSILIKTALDEMIDDTTSLNADELIALGQGKKIEECLEGKYEGSHVNLRII